MPTPIWESLEDIKVILETAFGAGGAGGAGGIIWANLGAAGQLAPSDGVLINRGGTWYASTVGDLVALAGGGGGGGGVDFSALQLYNNLNDGIQFLINDEPNATVARVTLARLAQALINYYGDNKQVSETIAQSYDQYGIVSGEGNVYFYGRNGATNSVVPMGAFDFGYRGGSTTTLLVYWGGALRNVEVGPVDSAGAGYRALRIPNG